MMLLRLSLSARFLMSCRGGSKPVAQNLGAMLYGRKLGYE
jgi:hypothetical protein